MENRRTKVLIENGYLPIEKADKTPTAQDILGNADLMTVITNINYYGYTPSTEAIYALHNLDRKALISFWSSVEDALSQISGACHNMAEHVVYQNFPDEVLNKTEGEYWGRQILKYLGFNLDATQESPEKRKKPLEPLDLKVLHVSDEGVLDSIYQKLLSQPTRWNDNQAEQAQYLVHSLHKQSVNMPDIAFRINGIQLMAVLLKDDSHPSVDMGIDDATDVLRLAAAIAGSDASLRSKVSFKGLSRPQRRWLCEALEQTRNLAADVAERQRLWKKFFRSVHPGDFKTPLVIQIYNDLYQGKMQSFAAQLEKAFADKHEDALILLEQRPGVFARQLHQAIDIFGDKALESFKPVADRLTTHQLIKLLKHFETLNERKSLVYPPKGNWRKLKRVDNEKGIDKASLDALRNLIAGVVKPRLEKRFPNGVALDDRVSDIGLMTNDQRLAPYGRGTVFNIPDDVKFIRSSSYWEDVSGHNTWFDNGWNFFDDNWNPLGAVCWDTISYPGKTGNLSDYDPAKEDRLRGYSSAIFSGDPCNSQTKDGKACQMIDLYLDHLEAQGVRYALWSVLCYSGKTFAQASGEVFAALQWGEEAQKGELFEPARAQMAFSLKDDSLSKFVAYIDLKERKLVYIDANLPSAIRSASLNTERLSEHMPAFTEYLDSLPTVADLFAFAKPGQVPVLYSDKDKNLSGNEEAFVFKRENKENSFTPIDLESILKSS